MPGCKARTVVAIPDYLADQINSISEQTSISVRRLVTDALQRWLDPERGHAQTILDHFRTTPAQREAAQQAIEQQYAPIGEVAIEAAKVALAPRLTTPD